MDIAPLVADLEAEQRELDRILEPLAAADWSRSTPAPGWSIADQIHHLQFFDAAAARALEDEVAFLADMEKWVAAGGGWEMDPATLADPRGLLATWRADRYRLALRLRQADPARRIPWFGRRMGLASFITARLMECWCHGQDVRDALGFPPDASPRLRHVADIGIRALPHAFAVNGLPVPEVGVRVEVEGPDGETWTWGEPGATGGTVRGTALDLCLVVTQRRHPGDTDLRSEGAVATTWLGIAQSYAGPRGQGRTRGQFPRDTPVQAPA